MKTTQQSNRLAWALPIKQLNKSVLPWIFNVDPTNTASVSEWYTVHDMVIMVNNTPKVMYDFQRFHSFLSLKIDADKKKTLSKALSIFFTTITSEDELPLLPQWLQNN